MSPLLTARPSVSVTLKLVAACAVTALVAAFVPLAGGDGDSSAAVPACLAVGIVCAALISHLLHATSKATSDGRMAWLSAGTTVALIGLIFTLLALPSVFGGDGPVKQSDDAAAARYVVWHVALVAAGAIALAGVAPSPRNLLIFGGLGALLLAWAAVGSAPLGDLASNDGLSPTMRALVALIVVAQAGVVALWWRRAGGALSWADMCVLALFGLSALDAFAYMWASGLLAGSWWASLALRA